MRSNMKIELLHKKIKETVLDKHTINRKNDSTEKQIIYSISHEK